jgi:hypothetical protein
MAGNRVLIMEKSESPQILSAIHKSIEYENQVIIGLNIKTVNENKHINRIWIGVAGLKDDLAIKR